MIVFSCCSLFITENALRLAKMPMRDYVDKVSKTVCLI